MKTRQTAIGLLFLASLVLLGVVIWDRFGRRTERAVALAPRETPPPPARPSGFGPLRLPPRPARATGRSLVGLVPPPPMPADLITTDSALRRGRVIGATRNRPLRKPDGTEYTAADIEELVALIRDPATPGLVAGQAVTLIARFGRGNPKVADILIAFAQQPVDWTRWGKTEDDAEYHRRARSGALEKLGAVGTPNAKEFLLRAMTEEGARELSKPWFEGLPALSQWMLPRAMGQFRGDAAKGLALFSIDDPSVRRLMAAEYENERRQYQVQHPPGTNGSSDYFYLSSLASAMGMMDMAADLGRDRYLELLDNDRKDGVFLQTLIAYIGRGGYSVPRN